MIVHRATINPDNCRVTSGERDPDRLKRFMLVSQLDYGLGPAGIGEGFAHRLLIEYDPK